MRKRMRITTTPTPIPPTKPMSRGSSPTAGVVSVVVSVVVVSVVVSVVQMMKGGRLKAALLWWRLFSLPQVIAVSGTDRGAFGT